MKLSDALVLDARIAGQAQERSIAGQVEFWAKLGRSVESMLAGQQVLRLLRSGGTGSLGESLSSVETPAGRKRVEGVLALQPFPHYKQDAGKPGFLVRIDEDGTETVGRFVNRVFSATGVSSVAKDPASGMKLRNAKKRSSVRPDSVRVQVKPAPRLKERES